MVIWNLLLAVTDITFISSRILEYQKVNSVGLQIIPVHYPPLPPQKKTLAVWLPVKFLLF